jgi:hypothetical protein
VNGLDGDPCVLLLAFIDDEAVCGERGGLGGQWDQANRDVLERADRRDAVELGQ